MDQLGRDESAVLTIPDAYNLAGKRQIPSILAEGNGANRPAMSDASDTMPSGILEDLHFPGFPADRDPLPVRTPRPFRRSACLTWEWDGLVPHDVPDDALPGGTHSQQVRFTGMKREIKQSWCV